MPNKDSFHALAFVAACALLVGQAEAAVQSFADRFVLTENAAPTSLRVLANDRIPAAELAGGSLSIIRQPTWGEASVDTAGTTTAADDVIRYQPAANRSGEDSLRYRVCGGGVCAEGEVTVLVRPLVGAVGLSVSSDSGFRDLSAAGMRATTALHFSSTALVEGQVSDFPLAVEPAPWRPFEGSAAVQLRVLPSDGTAREWRVLVDGRSLSSGDVDLYVGVDSNGDGLASANELRCAAAMSTSAERCEMVVVVPACGNLAYWVLAVNAGTTAHTARLQTFEVPMVDSDGSLAVTGPSRVPGSASVPYRVVWDAPTLADAESRVAYVGVSAGHELVGHFPVRIDRIGRVEQGRALIGGQERAIRLPPSGRAERAYIDVPPGATSLVVSARASEPIDLYLARVAQPGAGSAPPVIAAAPSRSQANVAASSAAASQRLSVTGTSLQPGRWYVVASNATSRAADVHVSAQLAGTAPVVRPGGYYDTQRSGHGLFLYPAGSEWAGLWYTYLQDGSPTWYYLQGPAPGSTGQWHGRVFRSVWDGTRNRLVSVGEVITTPSAADAFTFSFRIDGESGSEPFSSFGRGCPSLGGTLVNASSHWYDPVRAGTGYSVQLFPNYEFYAAFVYDAEGVARFLTAERAGFGGATATLPLDQLSGFCPLCTRSAAPGRQTVGVLERRFIDGRLSILAVDGTLRNPLPGRWAEQDSVQALGGPTSLQGCSP